MNSLEQGLIYNNIRNRDKELLEKRNSMKIRLITSFLFGILALIVKILKR